MSVESPPNQHLSLGADLRARRKALKISALRTAETAGISRVTLHRIERGEPTVNIGAVAAVAVALGLTLVAIDPRATTDTPPAPPLPSTIRIGDYTQLKQLAWQLDEESMVSPAEALSIYERGWRHVDTAAMTAAEQALVRLLITRLGGPPLLPPPTENPPAHT